MKTKFSIILASLAMAFSVGAGVAATSKEVKPVEASASSYWNGISGTGSSLFTAISNKIKSNTTTIGYDGLWTAYKKTDQVPGTSKIWDMYGGFQFTYQSGGKDYSDEGDCYNREHSIPKSWWGSTNDERYSDIIHLLPTDGYVNNKRSNYAFGEVSSSTYSYSFPARQDGNGNTVQTAGISKLGTGKSFANTNPGTVFEPADQYKGDFARIYYYFATRYGPQDKNATKGDGGKMFNNNSSDFYMTAYGKALMNKWHVQDPVSEKEINRNNGVETVQGNRNPYVDRPEWADSIFGSNYAETHGSSSDVPSLTVSATKTSIDVNDSTTLSATLQNTTGTVQWYVEDGSTNVVQLSATTGSSITVSGVGQGTKNICAYVGSLSDSIEITVGGSGGSSGDGSILFGSDDGRLNVNSQSVSGDDSLGNTWTVTTTGTTSFTPNTAYSQIGSSSKPATEITFTTTLDSSATVSSFVVGLGGFNGTTGNVSLKVGNTEVGSGSLSGSSDVSIQATNTSTSGSTLTVSITNIAKGVKAYSINYSVQSGSTPAVTLSSISVSQDPTKTTYTEGEYFDPTGLIITRTYSNATSDTYTYAGHTDEFAFNPSLNVQLTTLVDSIEIFYGDHSTEVEITVNASGGGGGGEIVSASQRVVSNSSSTYYQSGSIVFSGSSTSATASCTAFTVTWLKNNSSNNVVLTYAEIRVYADHSLSIAPNEGFTITSIVIKANNADYASAVGGKSNTNCTITVSNSDVTLTPTDGDSAVGFANSAQSRLNYITVNYQYEASEPTDPSLTWTAPTIDVFSGESLTSSIANTWNVGYDDGTGIVTPVDASDFAIKLGGTTVSLPYTWQGDDNGKTLCVSYNSLTTETTTVLVTQVIHDVVAVGSNTYSHTPSTKWTSNSEAQNLSGVSWLPSITWASEDPGVQNVDSTKGQQIGTGAKPARIVNLSTSDISGTISAIRVNASTGSSGAGTISIKVNGSAFGGNAKSISSTDTQYSFTGSASGSVEIIVSQPSTSKALYIKTIEIVYVGPSVISNKVDHKAAQRVAVKFAKAFNAAMDNTASCTKNMSTAWSTCSSAYNTFKTEAAALGSTEEAYAKNLVKYATAQYSDNSGEACIERMLKTYEICVTKHELTPFMSELITLSNQSLPNRFNDLGGNATAIIIVIGVVALSAIGGYVFIRKRKES